MLPSGGKNVNSPIVPPIHPMSSPPSPFDGIYRQCVEEIYAYWNPDMQREIAAHNAGWEVGQFDFRHYLSRSLIRFRRVYAWLSETKAATVCDIGGHWGILPLALQRLGYRAAMTERRNLYSQAFNPLFDYLAKQGVEILDADPFEDNLSMRRSFDAVTAMAVLEHYPHSLRVFFENVKNLSSPQGRIYLEVPNIAYWPKRLNFFFRGVTPLTPIETIYRSSVPFIGHHHEFTMDELKTLAKLAGLRVVQEDYFDYSSDPLPWWRILVKPYRAVPLVFPSTKEILAVVCERS